MWIIQKPTMVTEMAAKMTTAVEDFNNVLIHKGVAVRGWGINVLVSATTDSTGRGQLCLRPLGQQPCGLDDLL